MTDEDVRRHLESLLREYGEMSKLQARHDERIIKAAKERDEIRNSIEKLEIELLAAVGRSEKRTRDLVQGVDASCNAFREEYRRDRREALERADKVKVSNRTVVVAMIAGSATVLAAIIGAAAVLITGG